MGIMTVKCADTTLCFDSLTLRFSVTAQGQTWQWGAAYQPKLITADEQEILFSSAASITHHAWHTGIGEGIRSTYEGFAINGAQVPFSFETIVWIEETTGDVFFEFVPLSEEGIAVKAVYWPGYMEFEEPSDRWYSVLNILQGLLLPNTWENEVNKLHFDGQMCSCAAYMPWFGQIRPGAGYIAICQQPWDAAYQVDHPAHGPYSHVAIRWLPSLGKLDYRRVMSDLFWMMQHFIFCIRCCILTFFEDEPLVSCRNFRFFDMTFAMY